MAILDSPSPRSTARPAALGSSHPETTARTHPHQT